MPVQKSEAAEIGAALAALPEEGRPAQKVYGS